jgi:AsmA protein
LSKIAKYSLIVIGLIIATVILLMVMASVFIDPNAYRKELVQIVKTQTGRNLEISGDVSLSLFPWLGIQFGEMQLDGPGNFTPADFLSLRQANIRVAALPLLWGRVDIDHILIDGLSLHLLRSKQGQDNWTFATSQPTAAIPTKEKKSKEAESESGADLAAVRLGSLTLKDSTIHWHDQQADSKFSAEHLGMTLDRLASGEQADFSLVTDLILRTNKVVPIAIKSKLMIDWQQKIAQLISSKIELGEMVLESRLTARFLDNLDIEGTTKLNKMAPLSVLKLFDIDYKPGNKNALQNLQISLNFNYLSGGQTNSLSLKNINIMLDKSELTGSLFLNLDENKPHKFDLLLKNINTDHYLPAKTIPEKSAATKQTKSSNEKKVDDTINLPIAQLRSLNLSGKLKLENIRANGIGFNSVDTKINSRKGLLTLKPFKAELYEGKTQGHFQLDVRKNLPRYSTEQNLSNIQMGDLIKDMDIYDDFSGKGNLRINVTTAGDKVSLLKKNLKGSFSIKLGKGKLVGADFIRQLREARDLYEQLQGKQKSQSKSTGNETVYDQLTASAIITKGVINNQDLLMVGPKLQMTGKGEIDLPRNWIYYKLKANYQEKAGAEPIKAPIKIKGPLDNPSIKVQYQKVLRKESEKRLRKEVEKQLGNELRKGLEGLFR